MAVTYYKKYTGESNSIVDALSAIGVKDTSKEARMKIAKLNGIAQYTGTASQNKTLLTLLKSGKLVKKKSADKVYKYREKFLGYLQKYSPLLKKYGKLLRYSWSDSEPTFDKALKRLKKGLKTGLTCVVPCRWALKDAGIDPSGFYGLNGTFRHCYKRDVAKHLERIRTNPAIGMTVKEAVDAGLLKPGDIICFKNKTHTFVYSGIGYLMYDGGHAANYTENGILANYKYRSEKISEILRWVD